MAMFKINESKTILNNYIVLVNYVRNAGLNNNCKPKLKRVIETRWNAAYITLNGVYQNYSILIKVLAQKDAVTIRRKSAKKPRKSRKIP